MAKKSLRKFSIKDALAYGWQRTQKYFWPLMGLAALTYIAVPWLFNMLCAAAGRWGFIVWLVSILATVALLLVWTKLVLRGLSDKKHKSKNTRYFWILLGIYVWRQIIITLGLFLFVVPGIIWWIDYLYAPMLAVDKNLNISEAMRASRKLAAGQRCPLFWWLLVSSGIYIAGFCCFKVGLLLAMPITNHAGAYVYAKLAGRSMRPARLRR